MMSLLSWNLSKVPKLLLLSRWKVNNIVSCEIVDLIPISAIEDARRAIAGKAIRTPLVRLNFRDTSAEIYLKLENLQPIGSFKIRGAANAIARLSPEQLERGVVTASAGNMAQGVAWCAR